MKRNKRIIRSKDHDIVLCRIENISLAGRIG